MKRMIRSAQMSFDEQHVKDCAKAIQQLVKKSDPGLEPQAMIGLDRPYKVKMNSSVFRYNKNMFVTVVETNLLLSEENEVKYREFLDELDAEIQNLVENNYPDLEATWGRYSGRFSRGADWGYLVTYR